MTAETVLAFWFGTPDLVASPPAELQRRWFGGGPAFDREIADRFGALLDAPEAVAAWAGTVAGDVAAVVVFDQLARNAFRGTARAFAYDRYALPIASAAVDAGRDRELGVAQRAFLYLPFEHAEDRAAQDRAVALFEALAADLPPDDPRGPMYLDFARRHRDIVARFGRFPGRNRALGRPSTAEEAAWLAGGGETFGA